MVFKDEQLKIYDALRKEWHNDMRAHAMWEDFVASKDIGVIYDTANHTNDFVDYIIVDEKKWFFTRLKYGL